MMIVGLLGSPRVLRSRMTLIPPSLTFTLSAEIRDHDQLIFNVNVLEKDVRPILMVRPSALERFQALRRNANLVAQVRIFAMTKPQELTFTSPKLYVTRNSILLIPKMDMPSDLLLDLRIDLARIVGQNNENQIWRFALGFLDSEPDIPQLLNM
jgi:hypothetical protein